MITTMEEPMVEPERRTMPVRLGYEAIEAAKIAGSLKGMSLAEYATAVLLEKANHDIDEFSKARSQRALRRRGSPRSTQKMRTKHGSLRERPSGKRVESDLLRSAPRGLNSRSGRQRTSNCACPTLPTTTARS